jgi:hypothetical protein
VENLGVKNIDQEMIEGFGLIKAKKQETQKQAMNLFQ